MKFTPLNKESFKKGLSLFNIDLSDSEDFVYEIYSYTVEGIDNLKENISLDNLQGLNHIEIIGYCIGETSYLFQNKSKDEIEKIKKQENSIVSISSFVADKYLSLSQFSHNVGSLANRFSPPISTLYVYVNFMMNIVQGHNKKDPTSSLIADLFMKSISICKCTLDLLVKGFETEAFSTWRTLHECESTLIILMKYPHVTQTYLKHMKYSFAFRDAIDDKNKQTEIFMNMKEEMKAYDLKSKDIKKYIEYGWLYAVPGVKDDETFKLNFRDGLEKVAGLSIYANRYEMSSEIIHGTPLLVYSNREYFYYLTLLSTYESFFRLEQVFYSMLTKLLNEKQIESYKQMRNVYYSQLVSIHKIESEKFSNIQKK